MSTREENIATVMRIIDNWPRNAINAFIVALMLTIDSTTLNLIVRQLEASAVDEADA